MRFGVAQDLVTVKVWLSQEGGLASFCIGKLGSHLVEAEFINVPVKLQPQGRPTTKIEGATFLAGLSARACQFPRRS